jgi:zinc transporter
MTPDQPLQCIQIDMEGGARTCGIDRLAKVKGLESLYWVHLDYSQPEALAWLEGVDWIDPIIKNNLVDDDTRPRCFTDQSGLFVSLRGVNLNPGSDPEDMIAVRLWSDNQRIITSNRRKLLSLDDVRQSLDKRTGPRSAAGFVRLLVERLALRVETVIEQIEEDFDNLEDNMEMNKETGHRSEISRMRRQAIRLRRFLAPQREALEHLLKDAPGWFGKTDKAYLFESSNKFKRYLEELDAIRDRAVVAQEELLSRLSETLNRRMYVLSLVATLFLPLGFLTGLLGINVGGIPWAESPHGFWAICLIIAGIVSAIALLLKTKKWF